MGITEDKIGREKLTTEQAFANGKLDGQSLTWNPPVSGDNFASYRHGYEEGTYNRKIH